MTVSWNAGYGEDPVQRFPRLVGQHEGAHLHVRFVQLSFRLILAQFLLNLAPLELVFLQYPLLMFFNQFLLSQASFGLFLSQI